MALIFSITTLPPFFSSSVPLTTWLLQLTTWLLLATAQLPMTSAVIFLFELIRTPSRSRAPTVYTTMTKVKLLKLQKLSANTTGSWSHCAVVSGCRRRCRLVRCPELDLEIATSFLKGTPQLSADSLALPSGILLRMNCTFPNSIHKHCGLVCKIDPAFWDAPLAMHTRAFLGPSIHRCKSGTRQPDHLCTRRYISRTFLHRYHEH